MKRGRGWGRTPLEKVRASAEQALPSTSTSSSSASFSNLRPLMASACSLATCLGGSAPLLVLMVTSGFLTGAASASSSLLDESELSLSLSLALSSPPA